MIWAIVSFTGVSLLDFVVGRYHTQPELKRSCYWSSAISAIVAALLGIYWALL